MGQLARCDGLVPINLVDERFYQESKELRCHHLGIRVAVSGRVHLIVSVVKIYSILYEYSLNCIHII